MASRSEYVSSCAGAGCSRRVDPLALVASRASTKRVALADRGSALIDSPPIERIVMSRSPDTPVSCRRGQQERALSKFPKGHPSTLEIWKVRHQEGLTGRRSPA